MIRLRVLHDVDGWAQHHRALALQLHAPPDFEVSLQRIKGVDSIDDLLGNEAPDVLFVLDNSRARLLDRALRERGWATRLVAGWGTGWPRKAALFKQALDYSDCLVVNNREYWEKTGRPEGARVIENGVELDVFNIQVPIEQRTPRVLWAGAARTRDLKGYADYLLPLKSVLGESGIPMECLLVDSFGYKPKDAEQMARWYNTGTVYVCASKLEGTPNPALEAAASGCTVVSTRVGNMPELIKDGVNGFLVERDLDDLVSTVRRACSEHVVLAEAMQDEIRGWGWRERSVAYFDLFREVGAAPSLRKSSTSLANRPSLESEVTVFVTTIGDESFGSCMDHLNAQSVRFRLEVIDRVAPLSAALQRMVDSCETPYFVQVDEDMQLYDHAIEILYERISKPDAPYAVCVGYLYDAHLERTISGVKIFRSDVLRRYPLDNTEDTASRRLRALESDGHVIHTVPIPAAGPVDEGVLGLHGVHWTPRTIFERYSLLERRRRSHPENYGWFEHYPQEFLRRFLDEASEINFYALMGVLAGALSDPSVELGSRDHARAPRALHFEGFELYYRELVARRLPPVVAQRELVPSSTGPAGRAESGYLSTRARAMNARRLQRELGEDLAGLVGSVGPSLVSAQVLTTLPARGMRHASFKLTFDDGRVLKGRRVESAEQARRVQMILGGAAHPGFAPILARQGAALLEQWVEGARLTDVHIHDDVYAQCGRTLASLHVCETPPALGSVRDADQRLEHMRAQCRELQDRGVLTGRRRREVESLADSYHPDGVAGGYIHRDYCAENIVLGDDGRPVAVDNETIRYDAPEFDLARTCYRWPMDKRATGLFLSGYAERRSTRTFESEFPFWMALVLVDTTLFRARRRTGGVDVPLERLHALVAAPRRLHCP